MKLLNERIWNSTATYYLTCHQSAFPCNYLQTARVPLLLTVYILQNHATSYPTTYTWSPSPGGINLSWPSCIFIQFNGNDAACWGYRLGNGKKLFWKGDNSILNVYNIRATKSISVFKTYQKHEQFLQKPAFKILFSNSECVDIFRYLQHLSSNKFEFHKIIFVWVSIN